MTDFYAEDEIAGFMGGYSQDDQEYKFVVVFHSKIVKSARDIKGLTHLRYSQARQKVAEGFRKNPRQYGRIIDIDTFDTVA